MHFKDSAELFEGIEKATSRLDMTCLIASAFEKVSPSEVRLLVYLLQGNIAPPFKEIEIGLGEKLVIEVLGKVTGAATKEIDKLFKEKGDLGLTAAEIVKNKKQKALFSEELSLEKVFENFLRIARTEGKGSQELKIKLLAELINSSSSSEAKFIVRTVLEKMRLGAGDPTIMDAFAVLLLDDFRKNNPSVEKKLKEKYKKEEDINRQLKFKVRELIESKYNIYSDLGEISFLLKKKGLKGLDEIDITIGIPIRPTLAERLGSGKEIIEKLGGKCLVEAKYDGFRLAVHKDGEKVFIFSRNQETMTHMFPEIVKAVRKQIKIKKVIFEGEALAFNEETGEFYPFQITIQRKRKHDVEKFLEKYPLKLFAFDLLFDGKNLMSKSFRERRKRLGEIIGKGNVIELTDAVETASPAELEKFFDESVSQGLEGIIAKDLNAPYIAGARKFAWIKLKRSYKSELNDSIDVVVIGYYEGKGKRQQFGLGSLLTAVYNKNEDTFESVAKVATGLSEKELGEMEKLLKKEALKKKPSRVLSGLTPDHWVNPKYVIEVNADEITKSPMHLAGKQETGEGLALRFPRFLKLREDKNAEDSTTTKELIDSFKKQRINFSEKK